MIKQGGGAIVNTSSVGAVKPQPGFCAYTPARSGLNGLTKTAALEGAPHNIRVNTIMPGPTRTPCSSTTSPRRARRRRTTWRTTCRCGRLGDAEDMAEAVVWLCSDAAKFVTGQCMPIDGGITAR